MTTQSLKPWSQLEPDELASGPDSSPAASAPVPSPKALTDWRQRLVAQVRAFMSRPGRATAMTVALVAAAGAWTLLLSIPAGLVGTTWTAVQLVAISLLLASAVGLLAAGRRLERRATLSSLRGTVSGPGAASPDPAVAALDDDLRRMWQSLEAHASNADARLAEILETQKQLELDLGLAETRRQQSEVILAAIPDPLLVVDAYEQLQYLNGAAEELFGVRLDGAARRPVAEVLSDERLVRVILQSQEAELRAARRRLDIDVGPRVFAVTLSPWTAATAAAQPVGSRHGVLVILRDITKEREAARNKSEFVARVAHELRTPLSSIRAYVEMLVDGEAADEKTRKEYYNTIQTSADRLGRLIDNMLNISRIEAGTVRINKEPVAISMIVKEACDVVRPQAQEKNVTLLDEPAPVVDRIMADRDLIYEAILNLLSNAVKYTPGGGHVRVRMATHRETGTVRIEVVDTGAGIPPEDLPRMFEKFFRVERNKKLARGTGLGLHLVKQIVETVHNGQVAVTSEVGKGSCFSVQLPLLAE